MPRGDLPSTERNIRAIRRPSPVSKKPSAMKNAATMSSTAELENPLSASPPLTSMAPVIMAVARPISATEGVGRGCRMSPRMVATKIPSMCMPRGSTPSGAGMQ